jgi:hypothetical protein
MGWPSAAFRSPLIRNERPDRLPNPPSPSRAAGLVFAVFCESARVERAFGDSAAPALGKQQAALG